MRKLNTIKEEQCNVNQPKMSIFETANRDSKHKQ